MSDTKAVQNFFVNIVKDQYRKAPDKVEIRNAIDNNATIYKIKYSEYDTHRKKIDMILGIEITTPMKNLELSFNGAVSDITFKDPINISATYYSRFAITFINGDITSIPDVYLLVAQFNDIKDYKKYTCISDKSMFYKFIDTEFCIWRGQFLLKGSEQFMY